MVAGLTHKVTIYRHEQTVDDAIGGASTDFAAKHEDIPGAIVINMPNMQSQDVGLIVPATYSLTIQARSYGVYVVLLEDDEILVTSPTSSPLCGERFVVTGVQHSKRARRNNHIKATLRRQNYNRREQA